ncbi:A-kinase anchor protein 14 [Salminus brasiliensis]|uniref:A-kinase anchor protein 14 n=1 Tax=Salminus brasiliensis TaxID=930266 RepID=UPI003B837B8D
METEPGARVLELRATEFVNAVLDSAHSALSCPQSSGEREQPGYEIRNIDWVSCRDFTAERGRAQIEEYMRTWEMHHSWKSSVCFLQERELEFQTQFHYRALWSLPTSRTPIPRSTAAVHFIVGSSKTKPRTLPVEVHFLVESNKTVHRPGSTRFREKWLEDVIESKALLLDSVDF